MSVSVIVPTYQEARHIADTIASLRNHHPLEILVVDGGSTDGTLSLAQGADRVLLSLPGRAAQMNAGAAAARGEVFLFLHADCRLESGALRSAEKILNSPRIAAGCFQMKVEAPGLGFRTIDLCATARVRLAGFIYGDQGLFVRREVFERIGGFPPLRFMEDVFISRLLRREGRLAVSPKKIFVSPRRWQKIGLLKQSCLNWSLTALAAGGVHPDRLAKFYPQVR